MSDEEIETFNKFGVGMSGAGIAILRPPRWGISDEDARLLAAWLVSLSGGRAKFLPVLDAVENT